MQGHSVPIISMVVLLSWLSGSLFSASYQNNHFKSALRAPLAGKATYKTARQQLHTLVPDIFPADSAGIMGKSAANFIRYQSPHDPQILLLYYQAYFYEQDQGWESRPFLEITNILLVPFTGLLFTHFLSQNVRLDWALAYSLAYFFGTLLVQVSLYVFHLL